MTPRSIDRPGIDSGTFRAILGCFPASVAIVTSSHAGKPCGFTATSLCSLSLEPPLVLVCVGRSSNTLPALRHSGVFVVNFLAGGSEQLARCFASKSDDKFADIEWTPSAVAGGAPILEPYSTAYLECTTAREIEAGDHIILVGQVVSGAVMQLAEPLIYRQGIFRTWKSVESVGAQLTNP